MRTQNDNNELRNQEAKNSQRESLPNRNKKIYYQRNTKRTFNKTLMASNMLSLLEYDLLHHQAPPTGSVIVSLLLSKTDGIMKRIMNRDEYQAKINPRPRFQKIEVWLGVVTDGDVLAMHPFPKLDHKDGKHVREWREEMARILGFLPPLKYSSRLLMALTSKDVHDAFTSCLTIDEELDAICKYYEDRQEITIREQPYQNDFIFFQDYVNAIERYTMSHGLSLSFRSDTMQTFNHYYHIGLAKQSRAVFAYRTSSDKEDAFGRAKCRENLILEEIQNKLFKQAKYGVNENRRRKYNPYNVQLYCSKY